MVVMMLMLVVMGLRTTTMTGRTLRRMVSVPKRCPGLEEDVEDGGRRARCGRQSCVEPGILESSGRDRGC